MSTRQPSEKVAGTGTNWSLGAAIGAAIAASVCCTIPLLLISLGIGGAWISSLTALAPYQPFFIAVAVGALGYAAYREYRLSKQPECDCETSLSPVVRRALLGVATVVVIAFIASTWIIAGSLTASPLAVAPDQQVTEQLTEAVPSSAEQVVLEEERMTCVTCAPSVERALKRIDGVYRAEASYTPPEAVVHFDGAEVSIEQLTEATASVGFPSRVKDG